MADRPRTDTRVWFFNNCWRLRHSALYGMGAFFDLNRDGRQATMATDLRRGDHCIVATPIDTGEIEFCWFAFVHDMLMPKSGEPDETVRVLFGQPIPGVGEVLSKGDAATKDPYAYFFNVNGDFKRPSVMKPRRKCRASDSGSGPRRPERTAEPSV